MEEFLKMFGGFTVADIVNVAVVAGFLVAMYKKVKAYLDKQYAERAEREKAEKKRDAQLKEALDAIGKYPEYRAQSIKIQQELTGEIKKLREVQVENTKKLHQMDEEQRKRNLNKTRDTLLERYRYYTDPKRNPGQTWTKMEADAFWELFGDGERDGMNGYMHSVVQPAMNRLHVVENESGPKAWSQKGVNSHEQYPDAEHWHDSTDGLPCAGADQPDTQRGGQADAAH